MPRVVLLMCCAAACALARDTLADGGGQLTSAPPVPGATESDATPAVNLALSIRKQLMEGNYDYTGSEEQARGARRSGPLAEDPREGPPHSDSEQRGDRPRPHRYLLDEADGRRHYVPYTFDRDLPAAPAPAQIPNGTDPPLNATSPKLKYKLIEVPAGRKRRSGRRSGTHSRRFIQEEGAQGVALINLGSRPFPEFRLPAARRQYMQDQEDSSRPLRPRPAAARRQYMQDQEGPLRLHPPAPPRPAPTVEPGTDPAGRIVETDADSGVKQQMQCNSAFRYPQDNRTFVNWRKNELREKNEDYGDVAGGAKSNAKGPGPARSSAEAFRKKMHFNDESREVKSGGLVHPRSFNNPPRVPPAPLSPVFSKRPKLNHKHRSRAPPLEPQPASTSLAPTLPPAEDSLSRLLRTNPPPSVPNERMTTRKPRLNAALAGPKLRESPKLRVGAVFAYKASKEAENRETVLAVPDPHQLDMAQAVGGHVPSMRYKNRLCSRHVLIPEGPKYDSRGAVYLPAYSVKPPMGIDTARDYAATASPSQLLPKCCNCCKKSVLGCE